MAEFRRLRTQDDRATDDHVWRETAESRPGYATWPDTRAGNPSWWLRPVEVTKYSYAAPVAEGVCENCRTAMVYNLAADIRRHTAETDCTDPWPAVNPEPVAGETCKQWCGYCHLAPDPEPARAAMDNAFPRPHTAEWLARAAADDGPATPDDPAELRARIKPPRRRWWHRYTRRNP